MSGVIVQREKVKMLSFSELESWWLREAEAWRLAIRLGRFYRQWQTRRSVVVTQRTWLESFGDEVRPVTYPDINEAEYMLDIAGYERITETLSETEKIFDFMANNCGRLREDRDFGRSPIVQMLVPGLSRQERIAGQIDRALPWKGV